jgi:hypothetical protein
MSAAWAGTAASRLAAPVARVRDNAAACVPRRTRRLGRDSRWCPLRVVARLLTGARWLSCEAE